MNIFNLYQANLDGTKLIEASAGTGKTFTLAGLYIRYIVEKKLLPENIVVLTFTKTATAELKTRLRTQLLQCRKHLLGIESVDKNDKQLHDLYESYKAKKSAIKSVEFALLCFDQAAIYTINSFCQKIIDDFNSDCGSPVFQELIVKKLYVKKFVYEYWRQQQNLKEAGILATIPNIDDVVKTISSLLNKDHYQQVKPLIDWNNTSDIYTQWRSLANLWSQQKQDLLDYVLSGDFTGVTYKVAKREVYILEMQEFFSNFNGDVKKFCADTIVSKKGKNKVIKPVPEFFTLFQNLYEKVIYDYGSSKAGNNLAISFMCHCFNYVLQQFNKLRNEQGKFDYSDQVKVVHESINDNPDLITKIANQWQCVMVDEFQDTDSRQLQIFDKCFNDATHDLIYVGDPKQAIYDFRGADVFVYNHAKKQTPTENQFNLATNWRSSDSLLAATNAMFNFHHSFKFPWLKFNPSNPKADQSQQLKDIYPPIVLIDCPQVDRKEWLANEIKRFLSTATVSEKRVKPKNCAVLVSSNKDAIELYDYLLAQNISVSLWSESGVFSTQVARQLYYLIRALNYSSQSNVFTTLHGIFFGVSFNDLHTLDAEEITTEFVNYRLEIKNNSLIKVIKRIFDIRGVYHRLLQRIDGERHFADLQHLLELLQEQVELGNNASQLEQWLALQIQQVEFMEEDEQRKRRIESDGKKISIMTIHKSKGLEFDHVFIPYADKITDRAGSGSVDLRACLATHDEENIAKLYWRHYKEAKAFNLLEKQAENIRNLYVGLTRAKHRIAIGIDSSKAAAYGKLPIAQLLHQIIDDKDLCSKIENLPAKVIPEQQQKVKLTAPQTFKRNLQKPQSVYSFSALSKKQEISFEVNTEQNKEPDYSNYFQFPKGAKSGAMQHEILENLDFSANLQSIEKEVATQLIKINYDSKWKECLSQQVHKILNTPLWKDGVKLSEINSHVDEMEFMLPVGNIKPQAISMWLSQHRNTSTIFAQDNLQGYLTGFIDLVFEHQGKYYVVDYKSNYLGSSIDDYTRDDLQDAIEHHYYDLQYLLYSVALIKYLKNKITGFDYHKHFGGVAYIFTRGINGQAGQGVYLNKPDEKLINAMIGAFDVS